MTRGGSVYAIALGSYKATVPAICINDGSLAATKTVIYAAWCNEVSSNNNNFRDPLPKCPE